MYLEYHTNVVYVVLVFLDLAGNSFGVTYVLSVQYSRYYNRKKKIQSSIWRVRDRFYDRKKKSSSCLSGGCAIIITTRKKRYSCLSGGCAIIITTGKKKF